MTAIPATVAQPPARVRQTQCAGRHIAAQSTMIAVYTAAHTQKKERKLQTKAERRHSPDFLLDD